jgi:hypothetical protein
MTRSWPLSSWRNPYQIARGQAFCRLWKQLTIRFQFPALLVVGPLVAADKRSPLLKSSRKKLRGSEYVVIVCGRQGHQDSD